MAYFAVKGGQKAIKAAEELVRYYRVKGKSTVLEVQQIIDQMRLAVDQVMGEGSLYAPHLAALALKQAEGDKLEASFLLRAFRSTLSRIAYSQPVDTTEMEIISRCSATFRDIPGGQYLGPTRDFSQRLLDFELLEESNEQLEEFLKNFLQDTEIALQDTDVETQDDLPAFPKVIEMLRSEGLLEEINQPSDHQSDGIDDITRKSIQFPSSRTMRLQALSRGETGGMIAIAYSGVRGSGKFHPTIGELRIGNVPVRIVHPFHRGETITIGKIMVTEVEIIASLGQKKPDMKPKFSLGYGFTFGQNEAKAIAMAILDRSLRTEHPSSPAEDEEFVLYHIDGIESLGFINHFKLPHYVDFQAEISRLKKIRSKGESGHDRRL